MALSNLTSRILSAVILAPVILGIIYAGGIVFNLLVLTVALISAHEWQRITAGARHRPAWRLLGLFYILIPCLSLLWLNGLSGDAVIIMLLLVWATDIGAYIAGRTIGGPKLAPHISPNKTWAGLAGGMIFSAVTLAFIGNWRFSGLMPHEHYLPLTMAWGAAIAIVAQAGDLFESWVKRRFGFKDSGNLIPGHGGLLDRIDGLMFVVPFIVAIILLGRYIG